MSITKTNVKSIWFSRNAEQAWFGANPTQDQWICDMLLPDLEACILELDCMSVSKNDTNASPYDLLDRVILLDQVSRHASRAYPDLWPRTLVQACTDIAATLVRATTKDERMKYESTELCFLLMPLRHTKKLEDLQLCCTWTKDACRIAHKHGNIGGLLKRFARRTFENIGLALNKTILDNHGGFCQSIGYIHRSVLDPECMSSSASATTHANTCFPDDACRTAILSLKEQPRNQAIVVSVSGGVDSFVCAFALAMLRDYQDPCMHNKHLCAVHINYGNRHTNSQEEDLVTYICRKLQIPLIIRTIHEISRAELSSFGMRDVYEEVTKQVRFDMYKTAATAVLAPTTTCTNPIVVLGHNRTDVFENIIANIKNRRSPDNLGGMTVDSIMNGCIVLRPLLHTPKDAIIAYAKSMGLVYTYDSTPRECERGRIRHELLPALLAFSPELVEGLHETARIQRELFVSVQQEVHMFWEYYVNHETQTFILHESSMPKSNLFWDLFFDRVRDEWGILVSAKSKKNFVWMLGLQKPRKIMLNGSILATVSKYTNTDGITTVSLCNVQKQSACPTQTSCQYNPPS